jgi:uncharacterized phage protein (TIGR01671 family)
MREFKFRVWHKKENRWLDPWDEEDPILSLKDYGHGCEVFTYNRERKSHDNLDCLMTDVVIQQYTGLKDKNGKEIYESDVLQYTVPQVGSSKEKNATESGMVVFDRGVFWCNYPLYEVVSQNWNCTIIGNIYEDEGLINE